MFVTVTSEKGNIASNDQDTERLTPPCRHSLFKKKGLSYIVLVMQCDVSIRCQFSDLLKAITDNNKKVFFIQHKHVKTEERKTMKILLGAKCKFRIWN